MDAELAYKVAVGLAVAAAIAASYFVSLSLKIMRHVLFGLAVGAFVLAVLHPAALWELVDAFFARLAAAKPPPTSAVSLWRTWAGF